MIASDAQVQELDASPLSSAEQVFDVISAVVKGGLNDQAQSFLRVVIENRRLSALPEMAVQFRALSNRQSGVFNAEVFSAFPLADSDLQDLLPPLEKRFGRRLNLNMILDASLIGGVRVVVGDEVLDTSVKARLEQMKAALTT
jgi:F-type H+-transporting ATPase subunit delta